MRKKWLWLVLITSTCFAWSLDDTLQHQENDELRFMDDLRAMVSSGNKSREELEFMLHREAPTLSPAVINKVITSLACAKENSVAHNQILTVIDYSLPSSEKRLWVFDLKESKLRFHTYVSHGIKSGAAVSHYFSNKYNSKASSIGVYTTEKAYYGRHGISLKLDGMDAGFNDNAANRAVVMHGGWYVDDDFVKKYGRAGRSWGCPAVPDKLIEPMIHLIKDDSLVVIYYPSEHWFLKSKFLNCERLIPPQHEDNAIVTDATPDPDMRPNLLFVDRSNRRLPSDMNPLLVMSAEHYALVFQTQVPLERMLRRPIGQMEYIALSDGEFNQLVVDGNQDALTKMYLVEPEIQMVRGYYATEMKLLPWGKIKEVKPNASGYSVSFDAHQPVNVKTTHDFIRWVGL